MDSTEDRPKNNSKFKKISAALLAILNLLNTSYVCSLDTHDKDHKKSNFKLSSALLPASFIGAGAVFFAGQTAAGCIIGRFVDTSKIKPKNTNDIIENMTDEEIKINLKNQIKKFENIGQGYFKVDKSFLEEFDEVYCLHTMISLNTALEKYPVFTKTLVEIKKRQGSFFKIFASNNDISDRTIEAMTDTYFSGIQFAKKNKNFKEKYELYFYATAKKFKSDADIDKLIDTIVLHELGHIFQFILMAVNNNFTYEVAAKMKEAIIKIARKKYKSQIYKISTYGDKTVSEWFAEVFSHLACSQKPNALGKALSDYLEELEKNNLFLYYSDNGNKKPIENKIIKDIS